MTKSEVVDRIVMDLIFEQTDSSIDTAVAEKVVNTFMKVVKESVADGKTINLRGFGSFEPVKRAAKPARNIKTGEAITVPARTQPVFVASKDFKNRVSRVIIEK